MSVLGRSGRDGIGFEDEASEDELLFVVVIAVDAVPAAPARSHGFGGETVDIVILLSCLGGGCAMAVREMVLSTVLMFAVGSDVPEDAKWLQLVFVQDMRSTGSGARSKWLDRQN